MQSTFETSWWKKMSSQGLEEKKQQGTQKRLLDELKFCASTKNLQRGKEIHVEVIKSGNDSCIYLATTLVKMYANCKSMAQARLVFDNMKKPDVVSWTALILGYAENGDGFTALDLFARMGSQGCVPNSFTYVAALKACTSLAMDANGSGRAECLARGKEIHSQVGCYLDMYVQNTLIEMYAKCGSMTEARQVFDSMKHPDVVSWNTLILGYADNGNTITALDLFARMRHPPDSLTFVAALKACTSDHNGMRKAECLKHGKEIHSRIGHPSSLHVENSLINMYAKCGSMSDARHVFNSIRYPNVVSWTALILGYVENGEGVTALDLFARMKYQGCPPNDFTFVAVLKACALLGALVSGRKTHSEIDTGTMECNVILVNSLVDFYAKCGSLTDANNVFNSYPKTRNLITWNALLAAYSRLGDSNVLFGFLEKMQEDGFQPNGVTFLCILTCCSHAGLIDTGRDFLEAMPSKYGITPTVEHYTCLVDVLSRSNKLDESLALLQSMPCKPDLVIWMTVLAACRKWKNVKAGELAFKAVVCLDERHAAAYVLMAHIYGSRGMWKEQEIVLAMRGKA